MTMTPGPWIVFAADENGPNDVLPAGRPGCIASAIESAADARAIAMLPVMVNTLRDIAAYSTDRASIAHARKALALLALPTAKSGGANG